METLGIARYPRNPTGKLPPGGVSFSGSTLQWSEERKVSTSSSLFFVPLAFPSTHDSQFGFTSRLYCFLNEGGGGRWERGIASIQFTVSQDYLGKTLPKPEHLLSLSLSLSLSLCHSVIPLTNRLSNSTL